MRRKAKIQRVKEWLLRGWTITDMQARNHFNYTRLADGIYKLKNKGLDIENINKRGKYAKYKLKK